MKFLFYLLFVFSISTFAQDDAGFNKLKKQVTYHIDKVFSSQNSDSAFYHAKKSLFYAKQSKDEHLLMECYDTYAYVYKIKNDFEHCEVYAAKCLKLARKLDDTYYQFLCYNLYGIIRFSEKQYQLSTEYFNEALKLAKKENEPISISLMYQNIALNYYLIGETEIAKTLMLKAVDVYNSVKEFNDPLQKDSDYVYLYMKLSLVTDSKIEALKYVDLSLKRAIKTGFNNYISLALLYKGRVHYKYAEYNLALKNYKKALYYSKKANVKSSDSYLEVINVLATLNMYDQAKLYLDTLHANFSEKDIRPIYIDKYELTAKVYKNIGDYDKAIQYIERKASITDSLFKNNNYKLFAEYGKKFETTEKENEIKQQQLIIERQKNENKNILLYSFSGLFIGLLVFQWLYITQKSKKKEAMIAYKKEYEFNQMRTAFLENISHEIRTPLTLINGYLNLINEEVENDKIKGYVNNALVNSKKIIFDADDILNLLKFEDHKISLNTISEDLNEFLKRIFLSFKVLATTRNIELVYISKIPNNYNVEIDAGKIERVLTNLMSNAIKFSDSNSKVIFEAEINNEMLIVNIVDFGQGISKEDQERIFTRFYQSKNNKAVGGIGIGLLLAKDFAQFLGGDLTVESTIGEGSTFKFTMPLYKNEIIEECEDVLSTKGETSFLIKKEETITDATKPSLLIVEDSIEMSNYLKEILSPFYNCSFAFDGLEALNMAKAKLFDLVASDVMMPKINGYEFKKTLKLLPEYSKIPFILITAKSLAEDKMKGFSIGIDDYITKPFNKEELIVRINNLLRNGKELKLAIATAHNSAKKVQETHVDKLLNEIEALVLENLSNENFKVEELALKMNYSQRQLSRILNRHTGLSTIKFILEIKLREAYKLIENKKFKTISEVQYEVGITSSSYFSEKFKNRYGINPSELMKK